MVNITETKNMKLKLAIVVTICLSGCASTSPIQLVSNSKSGFSGAVYGGEFIAVDNDKSGSDQYRIFHQAATGFVSVQNIREDVENRATDFCGKKGQVFKTLSEQTSMPPYMMGNFPRIEIIFVCTDRTSLLKSYK